VRQYDPYDQDIRRDPYVWFTELRQTCPVNHHVLSDTVRELITVNPMVARPTDEFWQVFSYEHAVAVLQDPVTFSSLQGQGPERAAAPNEVGMLIYADPPHHTRHRQIVSQALNARVVNAMEPRIREIAEELVAGFAADGHGDVVAAFTAHFPGIVFAEILGVPSADTDKFERWAQSVVDAFGGNPEILERSVASIMEMAQYFMALKASRLAAAEGGEELPDDLFSKLLIEEYEGRTPPRSACSATPPRHARSPGWPSRRTPRSGSGSLVKIRKVVGSAVTARRIAVSAPRSFASMSPGVSRPPATMTASISSRSSSATARTRASRSFRRSSGRSGRRGRRRRAR
jgi:hypothetical protein